MAVPRQLEESVNSAAQFNLPPPGRPLLPAPLPPTAAQRSNFLPLTAAGYMSWRSRSLSLLTGSTFSLEQEAALFRALCRPHAGQRWLDAGTSAGYYAGLLAQDGASVLACDISPAMLRVAQRSQHSPLIAPLIDWALLNTERSGLPGGGFDGVCIGATLNETGSAAAMLSESARLLKVGGQLWIMYLARNGGAAQALLSRLGGLNFPDPAELPGWLPDMQRRDLRRVREVVFERWVKR